MAKKKKASRFEKAFSDNGTGPKEVCWDVADASLVYRLVVAVSRCGGAVLFGATRDQGAWALRFNHDEIPGRGKTIYEGDEDLLNQVLEYWVDWWEGYVDELEAPQRE